MVWARARTPRAYALVWSSLCGVASVAQARTAESLPLLAGLARRASRNIRVTVVACVVLICGAFAAAALLQMRNDRVHALAQAEVFEAERAGDIAAATGASLDRIAAVGRSFVDGKIADPTADGIANITAYDASGLAVATAGKGDYPEGSALQLMPNEVMIKQQKGFNPKTHDWEFFYIDVDKTGSKIFKRGFAEWSSGDRDGDEDLAHYTSVALAELHAASASLH